MTPGNIALGIFGLLLHFAALTHFRFIEFGLQLSHGLLFIAVLATVILANGHNPRGNVRNTHGRFSLLNVLTARARSTENVNTQISWIDFHFEAAERLDRIELDAAVFDIEPLRGKLIGVLSNLAKFAETYKDMPCLAYTHCQPAQLTTVGKRATLWMNEFYMDVQEIEHQAASLSLRGVKGTTGTQASFMELFGGNAEKVKAVEADVCAQMGFDKVVPVCGQTYSRKVDYNVLSALGGLAQSAMKMATDIRLLANFKEMEEPFEKNQIGSSAMPYKRNPMRCERICALARYLMIDVLNPAMTAGTQWFERTLDDSANKRIAMAEGFLAADAILNILLNVSDGLVVYPKVVRSRVMAELPFMASENIMMKAVKKGGDRQELHERLREHAVAAAAVVKQEGQPNDMIARVEADPAFGLTREEIESELQPEAFTGRAPQQVEEYLDSYIRPLLAANPDNVGLTAELSV